MAFQELKLKCITAPVLAFADFHKPFLLETDASGDGLGAVLSQKQEDGHYHPVTYASHGLEGGELRYHSSKLEFLTLKWAIMEQFREYLQYQPFRVKTDNNPITYMMSTPNLDAVGHRWVASLAGFNFTIKYLKGMDNKVADVLSWVGGRLELDTDSVCKLLSHWILAQQSEPVIQLTTEWLKHPKDDHSTLTKFLKGRVPDQIQ